MKLTWYGHAAFLLASDDDTVRVGLDPYRAPDAGTYAPIDDIADLVAISHENAKYHSHIAGFRNRADLDTETPVVNGLALLRRPQPETVLGVPFTAVRVWENDRRDEEIAMLGITIGGIRFLHMGDCGHALDPATVAACGQVDVLLALAGEGPTIDLTDLLQFVVDLRPRVVIPMHFGNEKINLNLRPLSDFLAMVPTEMPIRHFDTATIAIEPESLPQSTEVWVLPPAR